MGSVIIILIAGKLISTFGSKNITMAGALSYHITLPLIFLMPNYVVLWMFLIILGFGITVQDIAMNSQGVEVEKHLQTSVMSSLHAFFSIGGVVGSVIGGVFVSFKITPEMHLLTVSLLFLPFTLLSYRYLRPEKLEPKYNHNNKRMSNWEIFTSRNILILGVIAFIAVLGEMMMSDWSVLYLLINTDSPATIAALGFATFSLFMTIGRLSGDALSNRMASDKIMQLCSILASGGIIIAVISSNIILIFAGFGLLGIGLSVLEIGSGIAGVGFFAYLAGFIEPIFIGQVAEYTSLKVAFFTVAQLTLLIFFMSKGLKKEKAK